MNEMELCEVCSWEETVKYINYEGVKIAVCSACYEVLAEEQIVVIDEKLRLFAKVTTILKPHVHLRKYLTLKQKFAILVIVSGIGSVICSILLIATNIGNTALLCFFTAIFGLPAMLYYKVYCEEENN